MGIDISEESAFEQQQLRNACYVSTICDGITFRRALEVHPCGVVLAVALPSSQEAQEMAQFCTRQRA